WKGVLRFDEFAHTTLMAAAPPWCKDREEWQPQAWTDNEDTKAAEWMQRSGIMANDGAVAPAAQAVAKENGFHPVRDYLNGLVWDGRERLETVLPAAFGVVKNTAYVRSVFRAMLIAAVARI